MSYPRAKVSLGRANTAVLRGEDDLSTWDIDELREGRRKNHRGKFVGRKPKVVPKAIHTELVKRTLSEAYQVLTDSVVDAVRLWADVLNNPDAPLQYRMEAAKEIKEAVMGKAPIHIDVKVEPDEPSPWDRIGHTVVIRQRPNGSPKAIETTGEEQT